MTRLSIAFLILLLTTGLATADNGDPQVKTDHPWYPGELSCSTFERLFATEAELYKRVVGVEPKSDEQKALAAWLWRNTHYWHGTEAPRICGVRDGTRAATPVLETSGRACSPTDLGCAARPTPN